MNVATLRALRQSEAQRAYTKDPTIFTADVWDLRNSSVVAGCQIAWHYAKSWWALLQLVGIICAFCVPSVVAAIIIQEIVLAWLP